MPMNCPNCQRPVRPGAKYCGYCGYILDLSVTSDADVNASTRDAAIKSEASRQSDPKSKRAKTRRTVLILLILVLFLVLILAFLFHYWETFFPMAGLILSRLKTL